MESGNPVVPHPVSSTIVQRCLEPESVHRPGSSHRVESTPIQRHLFLYHTGLRARQSTTASPFSSKDGRWLVQGFLYKLKESSVRMRPASSGTSVWTRLRCSLLKLFECRYCVTDVKEENKIDCFLLFWPDFGTFIVRMMPFYTSLHLNSFLVF